MDPLTAATAFAGLIALANVAAPRLRAAATPPFQDKELLGLNVRSDEPADGDGDGERLVDICFVHGITGDARSTWTGHDPDTGGEVFWPTDLLAKQWRNEKGFPRARILMYGYDTEVGSACWLMSRTLRYHANHLLAALTEKRSADSERPLIFVAHSLGGLLVRSALVIGQDVASSVDSDARKIYRSTIGVISFGTPQTLTPDLPTLRLLTSLCGLPDTFVKQCSACKPKYSDLNSKGLKGNVEKLCEYLDIYNTFADKFPEVYCYEDSCIPALDNRGPIAGMDMTVPPRKEDFAHDASWSIRIERNHLELAKFGSADKAYKEITDCIAKIYKLAIRGDLERLSAVEELLPSLDGSVRDAGFRVPLQLPERPQQKFVCLDGLNTRKHCLDLLNSRVSEYGVAILTGRAGCGKTRLALEYVYERADLSPKDKRNLDSILWLDAKSKRSLEEDFVQIAHQLNKHWSREDEPRPLQRRSSGLSRTLSDLEGARLGSVKRNEHRKNIVHEVLNWLAFPENKNWLLIYDGIEDEAAPYLEDYIPPEVLQGATRGRVIITIRSDKDAFSVHSRLLATLGVFKQRYLERKDGPQFLGPVTTEALSGGATRHRFHRSEPIQLGPFTSEEQQAILGDMITHSSTDPDDKTKKREMIEALVKNGSGSPLETFQQGTLISAKNFSLDVDSDPLKSNDTPVGAPKEHALLFDTCAMLSRDSIPTLLLQTYFSMSDNEALKTLKELQQDMLVIFDPLPTSNKTPELLERPDLPDSFHIPDAARHSRRERLKFFNREQELAKEGCQAIIETRKYLTSNHLTEQVRLRYEKLLLPHVDVCLEFLKDYGALFWCEWDILAELCESHGLLEQAANFYWAFDTQDLDGIETPLESETASGSRLSEGWIDVRSAAEADRWNTGETLTPSHPVKLAHEIQDTKNCRALRSKLGFVRVQLQRSKLMHLELLCDLIINESKKGRRKTEERYFVLFIGALEQLGHLKAAREEWDDSIRCYRLLIAELQDRYGPRDYDMARAVSCLAQIYLGQGDYERSAVLFEQAYSIYLHTLGILDSQTISALYALANVRKEQGQLEEARNLYVKVLHIRMNQLSEDHIETGRVKESLAIVLDMMGEVKSAEDYYYAAINAAKLLGKEGDSNEELRRMRSSFSRLKQDRQVKKEKPMEEQSSAISIPSFSKPKQPSLKKRTE